ncbi:flagellar basal body-associated FliL family protein [Modestobacter altitudinis]|uniref:flagellar basal body-associated FliL family protein n=1 Tax=Modestobacter altitudinis TaxID=2213158 RepID=UPI00110CB542|nr:flagellar basal body-associated FliL family protein [Modestobacter altitudinis]
MSASKTAVTPEDTTTDGRGGRKKLLIIALVVLIAAGAAAYFLVFSGGDTAEAEAETVPHGPVIALDPVAVNLAGGRYLKISIALHMAEVAEGEEAEPDGSRAKDIIIGQFSQVAAADVMGSREALKAALKAKIIEAYEGEVAEIYYTEYVTQ